MLAVNREFLSLPRVSIGAGRAWGHSVGCGVAVPMICPVQSARLSTMQTDMTLTFARFTIETTRGHFYADHAGRRAVFLEFRSGFPFWDFEKRRSETDLELWGFGMYASVALKVPNWMPA